MKAFAVVSVLNRLFHVLCRSLPAYLADARAWGQPDTEPLRAAIGRMVADQQMYAQRLAEAIVHYRGRPTPGSFPNEFTAKHDLALSYLIKEILDYQQRDVALIERCAAQLESNAALHALAEEILGNAKGHRDVLAGMVEEEMGI
jgi:predicted outer membrane protein